MLNHRKKVAILVETSLGSGREILRGIAKFARQAGDWQLFHKPSGLSESLPKWLDHWDGDAIIARIQNAEMRDQLEELNIPVVDVLGVCQNRFPLVHVDDRAISKCAYDHFLERNFEEFGFYGITDENWSMRRREAFEALVRPDGHFHLLESPRTPSPEVGAHFEDLQQWVRELPKPAAILVCSDQRGLELLEACLSENIPVPEQIAVVGVDNDAAICEISAPPLSSVRGGHHNVGFAAANLVNQWLEGHKPPQEPILVPPNGVVERESSHIEAIHDEVVARGMSFIRENLAERITNTLIARAAGVSRTLFQKRFRECTGLSIREYILKQRIDRAIHLITSSDFSLAEIADRCGFRHQEYLGQVIKKATGSTPGAIRRDGLEPTTSDGS